MAPPDGATPGRSRKSTPARDPTDNLLLTERFRLGLDGRAHRRNLNVLVVGGSGSGKTRFYAKPNVMQGNTSFVVTDPKARFAATPAHL